MNKLMTFEGLFTDDKKATEIISYIHNAPQGTYKVFVNRDNNYGVILTDKNQIEPDYFKVFNKDDKLVVWYNPNKENTEGIAQFKMSKNLKSMFIGLVAKLEVETV